MKKHKSGKSETTSASNSKAELFVLPPELLAQLGINLRNIQHSEVQSPDINLVKDSNQNIELANSNSLTESKDTSSILETANLMKESVFLSPIFQQTVSNVMPNEEGQLIVDCADVNNISPKNNDVLSSRHSETEDIIMCEEIACEEIPPNLFHETLTIINSNHEVAVDQMNKLEVFESVKEYQVENQDGNLILTDVPLCSASDKNSNKKLKQLMEAHSGEIYPSDCNNDYSNCPTQKISFGGHEQKLHEKKATSEEVARSPPQLKDTVIAKVTMDPITTKKVVHTDLNAVITVGKETENIISWTPANQTEKEIKIAKINYDTCNKSTIHISDSISAEEHFEDTNEDFINRDCVDDSVKNKLDNNIQNKKIECTQSNQKNTAKHKIAKNQSNDVISNVSSVNYRTKEDINEQNSTEIKNGLPDRVKEIAAYLSQIYTEKKKINSKNCKLDSKNGQIKLKLECVQGVEKPGGKLIQTDKKECINVYKTYQRKGKKGAIQKKSSRLIQVPDEIMTIDMYQLPNNPCIDIHDDASKNPSEFCICHDFGNLAYYDCEMLYEHIHFWSHNSVDCDLNTLYSIYCEDNIVVKQNIDFVEDDNQIEQSDDEGGNLCWNELNRTGIKSTNNSIISTAETDINFDIEGKINRKRSSNVMNEASEPNAKIKNKCGADDKIMAEKECKVHETNVHNPVTVKADQLIKINSTTTSETPTSTNSTNLPLIHTLQECILERNDSPVTAFRVVSTAKILDQVKDLSSNPSSKVSTEEIDISSKCTTVYENADIDIRSKIFQVESDVSSKLNQDSINSEIDVSSCFTRRTSMIDVTAKLPPFSLDMVDNNTKLSATLKNSDKLSSSKIAEPLKMKSMTLLPGVSNNVDRRSLEVPVTVKTVHETINTSTKFTQNSDLMKLVNTNDNTLRKKSTESTVALNVDKVSDMTTSTRPSRRATISNETIGSTRNSSELNSDSSNLSMISTESNRLTKSNKSVAPKKGSSKNSNDTTDTKTKISTKTKSDFCDSSTTSPEKKKLAKFSEITKDVVIENKVTENTNSAKGLMDIDMKTNGSNTTNLENNIKINVFTRNNSKVKNSSSDYKDTDGPTNKPSTSSTDSVEVDEAVDTNISAAISKKASDQKNKATLKSVITSDSLATVTEAIENEKLKSLKGKPSNTKVKFSNNKNFNIPTETVNSQTTNPGLNDILNKTNDLLVENVNFTKSPTPIEDLSNMDRVVKSVASKRLLRKSSTDIDISESPKSTKRSSTTMTTHMQAKKAKVAETNNIVIEDSTNVSNTKQPEPTDSKVLNFKSNKNTEIAFTSKSAECLSQNDTATGDSNIPEELPIDTENHTFHIEFEVPISSNDSIKCGVCEKSVEDSKWIEHISEEHDYCAWRMNEPALNLEDEMAVKKHLQIIGNQNDGLKCSKCGLVRKFAKAYMRHVKYCNGIQKDEANISTANDSVDMNSTQEQQENDDTPLSKMKSRRSWGQRKSAAPPPPVTCGVCSKTIEESAWIEHIRVEHQYLAWKAGEKPLNVDDEDEVNSHLNHISKYHGGLICSKCGAKWNYVKKYLVHVSLCGNPLYKPSRRNQKEKITIELSPVVTCGICKLNVEGKNWIKHNQLAHEYLAWTEGEKPLNVDDPEEVKNHLSKIVNTVGELVCIKCGTARVHAHAYLVHVNACTNSGFEMQITEPVALDKDKFECGVCHERGNINMWTEHAMKKHYNVAWMVGDLPINVRNFYAVARYLKEYGKKHSLVCNYCRATRTSEYGFYAHILTCGKTDEEIDAVHNICEICNSKYLCVYRNQHLAGHRDQEQRREIRELKAQKAADEASKPKSQNDQPMGKRRAAEKAKKVIEKYTLNGKPVCPCGAIFKKAEELDQHDCAHKKKSEDDESDVSVKIEVESGAESESGDTDIDSNISDCAEDEDEEEQRKKKRWRVGEGSTKISRMPYRVNNYNAYLSESYKDFSNFHLTSENLFNEWRNSEYEVVPPNEMHTYLPALTESCKVRFGDSANTEWVTYKRFEARKVRGYSAFTGGAVQCLSWAPPNIADETLGNYLAVATHRGADVPRHGPDETPLHPALVQIWDFKQFNFDPTCSLGLALDYGIVWAMDWCPSGGRDRVPSEGAADNFRLGLLAVACSNGTCYILAVPCPPNNDEQEFVMYKVKPVAELKLCMTSERRVYQATSIKWSQQKGHDAIIVGYSDGTAAFYDLNTESPFLKTVDNNVTVFYPFQDVKSENSSITGVGVYPTLSECRPAGGWFSASVTGGSLRAARGPAARCHAPAAAAAAAPHWPAAMLSGDAPFMKSVTELEWWGGGRRLGASRAACACARCGRVCAAASPALRLLRCHPCYPELKKLIIATVLMVPLGQKKKRKQNDDLSVVVEPLTYEDAVEKYGLQFTMVTKKDQAAAQQLCNDNEFCPQRFPLSEIVAVAFCPSARFHDKLAVGTHSGMIFVVNA